MSKGPAENLGNIPRRALPTLRISLKNMESATKMRKKAPDAKWSVTRGVMKKAPLEAAAALRETLTKSRRFTR
ncbi:hypothetical protein [Caballeronia arvi]|uniref:hypothetical protein n=1 Tax=Caballeronia arvi TaxID=1777135 RepID=UPI00117DB82E|nr:hypothetical protein [Caballeronia arvi]